MSEKHWEWLQRDLQYVRPGTNISPFGKKVAQIIGTTWAGIYHLNAKAYREARTQWDSDKHIFIIIRDWELSTWDFDKLTKLVILSHDYCVRIAIEAVAPGYVKISFWNRKSREGSISSRHPTIEEAILDPEFHWRPTPTEIGELGL